jgi:hypothetical protein
MRTRLAVPLPAEATERQLAALATLADQLGQGRWDRLATSFVRLEQQGAHVPQPMSELLGGLAAGLRRAAAELEGRAAT